MPGQYHPQSTGGEWTNNCRYKTLSQLPKHSEQLGSAEIEQPCGPKSVLTAPSDGGGRRRVCVRRPQNSLRSDRRPVSQTLGMNFKSTRGD